MAVIKVYVEVDTLMDVPLEGVTAETRDYDVQQHRPEVLEELQRRLGSAFGGDGFAIVNFEFGLADKPKTDVPESGGT